VTCDIQYAFSQYVKYNITYNENYDGFHGRNELQFYNRKFANLHLQEADFSTKVPLTCIAKKQTLLILLYTVR